LAIRENALGPGHPAVATSLNNLAELYWAQARYADAEPLFKRALVIRETALGPDHPDVAASLNNLASVYQDQGRYAEADPAFERALAIREKVLGPNHPETAIALNNLASLYRQTERYAEALPASRRAVEILAKHLSVNSDDTEQRANRFYFTNYILIANEAAGTEPDQRSEMVAATFRVAQMARSSSTARAVAGMAARFATGANPLATVIRERQDLATRLQRLQADIIKAAGRDPAERDAADEAALRGNVDETLHRLDALDARIAAKFPEYAELSNPPPLTLDAARELLAPGEALLVYLITAQRGWLWVVSQTDAALFRLSTDAKALAEQVTMLRAALDPELNPEFRPFPVGAAYELYQKILGPAAPLLRGVRHLLIAPDGALESLPPSVLVTKSPELKLTDVSGHRNVAWLAREYAVTILPSVSSLRALRKVARTGTGSAPFLGVGDPVLEGSGGTGRGRNPAHLFRGGMADVDAVRSLPPLPDTAEELRQIATLLGASDTDVLLEDRASEPVLRKMPLEQYKVIEFATHGLMSGDLSGLAEPALVLTPPQEATAENDGLLTASKIATLKMNADWVVLSACNTAASDGTPDAGGLSGLAKAFFYAGARSVLVSNWSVASKATVRLVTAAFDELAREPRIGRAEAWRRAEIAMLDPSNPPEFAHPLAWAPFVLAGEGGAGR
jgi:CHAT domain-containing protein